MMAVARLLDGSAARMLLTSPIPIGFGLMDPKRGSVFGKTMVLVGNTSPVTD